MTHRSILSFAKIDLGLTIAKQKQQNEKKRIAIRNKNKTQYYLPDKNIADAAQISARKKPNISLHIIFSCN